jgi:hypothetical protein
VTSPHDGIPNAYDDAGRAAAYADLGFTGTYLHIRDDAATGWPDTPFDLVLAAFPFDNIADRTHRRRLLGAIRQRLAPDGRLVLIASAPELYAHEWLSFTTSFPENAGTRTGDVVRIAITDGSDPRPIQDILGALRPTREQRRQPPAATGRTRSSSRNCLRTWWRRRDARPAVAPGTEVARGLHRDALAAANQTLTLADHTNPYRERVCMERPRAMCDLFSEPARPAKYSVGLRPIPGPDLHREPRGDRVIREVKRGHLTKGERCDLLWNRIDECKVLIASEAPGRDQY